MNRYCKPLIFVVMGATLGGCVSPQGRTDYTASGALIGGAIGSMGERPGTGLLAGALVGGLIGHGMDQAQESELRARAPQTLQRVEQSQPLTISDIESLTRAGINDDLIISQIRNSRTVYHLRTGDIVDLKNAGVSERVIDFMINTPTEIPSAEVAGDAGTAPPAPAPESVIVAPGPDYVWVGGNWVWFGDRWHWHRGYWHRPMYRSFGHRYR
jgi:hypothetical protein